MLELTDIEREQLSSMPKEVIQASQEEILTIVINLIKESNALSNYCSSKVCEIYDYDDMVSFLEWLSDVDEEIRKITGQFKEIPKFL